MLSPIQYLLLSLAIVLTVASIKLFHNKLYYRLLIISGLLLAFLFILSPGITTNIALILNVGRGVDLIFYLLFFILGFALIIIYKRLLKLDETITAMNRQEAIRNAKRPIL